MKRTAFLKILAALVATLQMATVAMARPSRVAREMEKQGVSLFARGEYQAAAEVFADAYAETGDAIFLRYLGRTYQKLQEPQKAISSFKEYLRRQRVPGRERKEVRGFIADMQALAAKQEREKEEQAKEKEKASQRQRQQAVAKTESDGATQTEPSSKKLAKTLPPHAATPPTDDVALAATSAPHDKPQPTPFYKKWWVWTAVGVVAGAAVGFVALSGGGDGEPCAGEARCGVVP